MRTKKKMEDPSTDQNQVPLKRRLHLQRHPLHLPRSPKVVLKGLRTKIPERARKDPMPEDPVDPTPTPGGPQVGVAVQNKKGQEVQHEEEVDALAVPAVAQLLGWQ